MAIFQMTESDVGTPPDVGPPPYKKDMSSLALIASDGQLAICLARIGWSLDCWFDEMGESEHQAFEDAPVGLSVWEGNIITTRSYWGEYDAELIGVYRPLTDDEREDYKLNGGLWDPADWYDPEPSPTEPKKEEP